MRDRAGHISYWRSGDREVDFIVSQGDYRISIEVKATERLRPEYSKPPLELVREKIVQKAFAIYTGERVFKEGDLWALPCNEFLSELFQDRVWSPGSSAI